MPRKPIFPLLAVILAAATPAHGQVIHQVNVGGPDICEAQGFRPGCHANFSLVALEFASGTVAGEFTDRGPDSTGFHASVDCLSIVGNQAWVGGVVTKGTIGEGDLTGQRVIVKVRDNGTSRRDPPDEISFSVFDDQLVCYDQPSLDLYPVPQGQAMVR